jgi:hypothetical protein
MKSNKISIKHIEIDGQEILFPSQEDWKDILLNPVIDGKAIAVISSIERELPIANQYPDIYLGLGFVSVFDKWTSYVFFKIGEHFQRVHLEKLTCKNCDWQGMTANPMVIDPYFGDGINQDHFTLMRYAERYPVLKCPQCDSSLPRHPIWIEYPIEE